MNQYVKPEPTFSEENEIDLSDIARTIWRQKGLVVAVILITVLAVMSYHLIKATFSIPHQVDYPLSLTFLPAGKSSYPNGSPFSPNDIVAPSILQRSLNTMKLGLSVEHLAASLHVEYSNSLLKSSENKLAALLSNTKTPEDIRQAATDVLKNMRNEGRSYLTISLNLKKSNLSGVIATQLIQQIVEDWAQMTIERGLIDVAINRPLSPFVVADNANLIDSYDNAANYLKSMSSALNQLSQLAGSRSLAVEGMSLNDLQREVRALEATNIGPLREFAYSNSLVLASKNPAIQVRLYSRQRLLKLEHERLIKLIASYDAALGQLGQSNIAEIQGSPALRTQGSAPQFDQSFLSALLKLGTDLGSVESKKELFDRRTQAVEDQLQLEKEMAILAGVADKAFAKLDPQLILESSLLQITKDINKLQDNMDAFVVVARELILQNNAQLYVVDAAPQLRGDGVQIASKLSLYLVLSGVLGLMLGVIVALIRGVMLRPKGMQD